ncbi:MAG: peptidoglycan-binding domain-containing protein [bacterium]|nr:peptidoglycan-binding domain-containing protein [bacterium]
MNYSKSAGVVIGTAILLSPLFALAAVQTSSTSCPTLARTLARGAKGADVKALQQFLVAQGFLTSESTTGYFGALTEAAVQKFQASQSVVSSGTPATTGYGAVGPKTRKAIGLACANTSSSPTPVYTPKSAPPSTLQPQCPLVALPTGQACTGTWKEVKDTKGCTASWQCGQ